MTLLTDIILNVGNEIIYTGKVIIIIIYDNYQDYKLETITTFTGVWRL